LIKKQVKNLIIWWNSEKKVTGWFLPRKIKIWKLLSQKWREFIVSIVITIEKYTKNRKKRYKQLLNNKRWNNKNRKKINIQNNFKNKQFGENSVKNSLNNNGKNGSKSKPF
jgi:hypothetical protein